MGSRSACRVRHGVRREAERHAALRRWRGARQVGAVGRRTPFAWPFCAPEPVFHLGGQSGVAAGALPPQSKTVSDDRGSFGMPGASWSAAGSGAPRRFAKVARCSTGWGGREENPVRLAILWSGACLPPRGQSGIAAVALPPQSKTLPRLGSRLDPRSVLNAGSSHGLGPLWSPALFLSHPTVRVPPVLGQSLFGFISLALLA